MLGATKILAEKILEMQKFSFLNIRLPGVVSYHINDYRRPWLNNIIYNLKKNRPIKIYNSGNSIGGTTISGDNISTGNIKSNTWDGDVRGTQISLDEGEIRAKGNSGDGWFLNTAKGNFDFSVGGIPATDEGITWEDTSANEPAAGSGTSGGSSYQTQDQQDSPA